jgi:hypothetical protein
MQQLVHKADYPRQLARGTRVEQQSDVRYRIITEQLPQ